MEPIRLPIAANNIEDTGTKGVEASPKHFSNLLHGGRYRKSSIGAESLGCLSLLDEGEQLDRPRALPIPGLAGEMLATYVKVQAQPTGHIQRPRAVLSSPENDELSCELQGQQGERSNIAKSAPKALLSPLEELPKAPLSPLEDLPKAPPSLSKELPKALASSPTDHQSTGDRDTCMPKAPAFSINSNHEYPSVSLPSIEPPNEPVDNQQSKAITSEATNEKPPSGMSADTKCTRRHGNDENLSNTNMANRMVKKHSSSPSSVSHKSAKQLSKPMTKGNSGRVVRPWY